MSISNSNLPDSLIQFQNFVQETDHDGVLQIVSYNRCNPSSDEKVKACRGLVYEGNTLLFPSFGYTEEYNCDTFPPAFKEETLSSSYIFPSYEGTLLRVFYHDKYNKWYVSTHRKLDAFQSRWLANETFGCQFQKLVVEMMKNKSSFSEPVLPEEFISTYVSFFDSLDRNHVYLFLLRPQQENRLVSDAPSQNNERLLHIATIKNRKSFDFEDILPSITKPYRLNFSDINELKHYVQHVDFHQQQGVILFYKDEKTETFRHFKLMNSNYQEYASVRGNDHNLLVRYLQIRSVPSYCKMLFEIYPERVNEFYTYETIIQQIAKRIHHAYIQRFVNKQYVVVSPLEYQIVKECHGWHIADREHNKVTLMHVLQTISKQDYVSILNVLIKDFNKNNTK